MPAPIGNTNGLKTGRRSSRPGVVLARLGKLYSQPYQDVLRLRRGVESLLKRTHVEVDLLQAARLQSACRLELSTRIAEQTLRDKPDLSVEQIQQLRHSVGQWTRERDNILTALLGDAAATGPAGIPAGLAQAWAAVDANQRQPIAATTAAAIPVAPSAPHAAPQPRQSLPAVPGGPAVAPATPNAAAHATEGDAANPASTN